MKVFQPIIDSGLDAGNLPASFVLEFSSTHAFKSEANCNAWIQDHMDSMTWREMYGRISSVEVDLEEPNLID